MLIIIMPTAFVSNKTVSIQASKFRTIGPLEDNREQLGMFEYSLDGNVIQQFEFNVQVILG